MNIALYVVTVNCNYPRPVCWSAAYMFPLPYHLQNKFNKFSFPRASILFRYYRGKHWHKLAISSIKMFFWIVFVPCQSRSCLRLWERARQGRWPMTWSRQNGGFAGPVCFAPWNRVNKAFFSAGNFMAELIRCILPKMIECRPFLRTFKRYFAKGNVKNEEKLCKAMTIHGKHINSQR